MIFLEQVEPKWNNVSQPGKEKNSKLDSEDGNDVTFTGQRIRWMKDPQSGPCIEVTQEKAIEELEEISVERNTKEDLHCTPAMHTGYRSILGPINWLPRRTPFL